MGSLNALGVRLEEARNFLHYVRANTPDPDHRIAVSLHSEWDEELIIRLMQARREMAFDYEGKKRKDFLLIDVLWATDFLDHMETFGLRLRPIKMTRNNDHEADGA